MSDSHGRTLVVEEIAWAPLQIRLNRPERLNAIDDVMRDELTAILRSFSERIEAHEVRDVVLTGPGVPAISGSQPRAAGSP
jgi:enoyl-CoA hydratase